MISFHIVKQYHTKIERRFFFCCKNHHEYKEAKGESQFSVLPLPLSFARSRESKGCPNSGFDRGVGVSGRGLVIKNFRKLT